MFSRCGPDKDVHFPHLGIDLALRASGRTPGVQKQKTECPTLSDHIFFTDIGPSPHCSPARYPNCGEPCFSHTLLMISLLTFQRDVAVVLKEAKSMRL